MVTSAAAVLDSLTDLLNGALAQSVASRVDEMHVAIPGRIESYDATKQSASVQPLIRKAHKGEDGERAAVLMPVIHEVPVMFTGGGGFRVTFPMVRGDTVLLVFSEQSLDKLLNNGGVVDPDDDRRNDLSDAIAIPGFRDFKHALKSAPTDRATIGSDTGAKIEFFETEIRAGGSGRLVTNDQFLGHSHASFGGAPTSIAAVANPSFPGTSVLRGFVALALAVVLAAFALGVIIGAA